MSSLPRGTSEDELLFSRAARAVHNLGFDTTQGDIVLYGFLVAQLWHERTAVPGPGMHAVRLIGRVFDLPGVYHRFERPALDLWSRWSLWCCGVCREHGRKPLRC
jgi:hypothetical protein